MQFLDFQVCRGCLATDTRMVDTRQHSASDFTRLVELLPTSKVGLPPCVCYECLAQLTKMRDFHAKNRRAYNVLLKILQQRGRIDEIDIKQIDRTKQNLVSLLKYSQIDSTSLDPNYSYSVFAIDDENGDKTPELTEIKVKFKQEKKIQSEVWLEDFSDFSVDESEEVKTDITLENKAEKENVKETEPKKVETEIKCKNVKNMLQKNRKKKTSKENSKLEPHAESKKIPKVRKKRTAGMPLKVDPMNCKFTEDFHSFFTVTVMTEEQRLEVFKQRSLKQQYINADYKCTDCYLGYISTDTYEPHRKKHDPNIGEYVCPLCKRRYKNQDLQKKHIAMTHRTKFECKICPYMCTNADTAKIHSKKHSSTTYRCNECNYISAHLASYNLHVSTMHGEETPCPCCGVSFLDLHAMRTHMDTAHPIPSRGQSRLRCECGVVFYNSEARKLHQTTSSKHTPECSTLLSCALCDSRFTDKQSLKAHIHTHPQDQKETAARPTSINCDQCGEVMADRKSYRKHYRQLHPDKSTTCFPTVKFPDMLCDICGKFIKGKFPLMKHRFLHTGLRPFECKTCGKTFAKRLGFDQHMTIHTGQYIFKCEVCGKGFTKAFNRDRHLVVHTQERLFACDICSKSFKSRVDKLSHTKYVHMNKPWPKRSNNKRKPTRRVHSDQESSD